MARVVVVPKLGVGVQVLLTALRFQPAPALCREREGGREGGGVRAWNRRMEDGMKKETLLDHL